MADFKFHCPGCSQKMRASDDMIGDRIECPVCRRMFNVPRPATIDHAGAAISAPPSAPAKCVFCGSGIPRDSTFCELCGKQQPRETPAPPSSAPMIQPSPVTAGTPGADGRRISLVVFVAPIVLLAAAVAAFFVLKSARRDAPAPVVEALTISANTPPISTDDDNPPPRPAPDVTVVSAGGRTSAGVEAYPAAASAPPAGIPPAPRAAPPVSSPPIAVAPPPAPEMETSGNAGVTEDEVMALFEKAREKYKEVLDEIGRAYQLRIAQVQTNFTGNLDVLERGMQEKGDLMGVLAVRKEKESFQKISETPPVIRQTDSQYPELTALKKAYNQQLDVLRQERDKENTLRTRQYDNRLTGIERQLTQDGRIEQALLVHQERERVRPVRDARFK